MDPKAPQLARPTPVGPGDGATPTSAEFQTGDWGPGVVPAESSPAASVSGGGWPRSFGPYELLGEIARGGMGVVYKARQRGLDRVVALKMVLEAEIGQAAGRFVQEARAAAALDHPNVVPIHDAGEIDGRVYFTMAFVDGPDLRGHLQARGIPPVAESLGLFAQTVAGVAHAHRYGIIHRDLKPANVLVDRDGRPRVTDFGLAKRAASDSQLTQPGQVMGTPAYMPPEQARDAKEAGPPADVYALGAILYYLLTGRPPFAADTVTALLIKLMSDPPVPPRELNPTVPAWVEAVCLRCLAKNPAARYADAQALLDALIPLIDEHLPRSVARLSGVAGQPASRAVGATRETDSATENLPVPPARTMPVLTPAPATPAARPRWLLLAGLGVVVLAAGAIFAVRPWERPSAPVSPQQAPAGGAGPAAADTAMVWPAATRGDFGLSVEFVTPANLDGGVHLIPHQAPLQVRLRAEQNCAVAVWAIDAGGEVLRIFPNKYDPDGMLTAGQTRVIPPNNRYSLKTSLTPAGGTEHLRVIATTGELPVLPSGERSADGVFAVYTSPADRLALASGVRGIAVVGNEPADSPRPKVADAELLYRVVRP